MKKIVIAFLSLILLLITLNIVFFYYGLPKFKISQITSCTHHGAGLLDTTNSQLVIPYKMRYLNFYLPFSPSLCDIYLKAFRGSAEDIEYLNATAGAYNIARENRAGENGLRNRAKNVENLKFLISKGLDVNAKTDFAKVSKINADVKMHVTSLYLAIASRNLEAVQILIDNGADPNIKDDWGMTALEMAVKLEESRRGAGYDGDTDTSGIVGILKKVQLKK